MTRDWKYTLHVYKDISFTAQGRMIKDGIYSNMVYIYNDEHLDHWMLQVKLKEAYDKFIKDNIDRLE